RRAAGEHRRRRAAFAVPECVDRAARCRPPARRRRSWRRCADTSAERRRLRWRGMPLPRAAGGAASRTPYHRRMRGNVRGWIVIAAAHVLCAFAILSPGYVRPDSIATFAYLRSAVFDRDFAFFNEWVSSGLVRDGLTLFTEVTPTGALANH